MYKGRILARSPYYVTAVANTAPILSAKLLVWVWTGDLTSQPANPTYTIDKLPLKGDDDTITFEISAIVKDFIDGSLSKTGGQADSPRAVWVATQISMVDSAGIDLMDQDTYVGHLGYGYYSDGVNPTPSNNDFTRIAVVSGVVSIATDEILTGNDPEDALYVADNYDIYVDGVFDSNTAITITDESKTKIQQVSESEIGGPRITAFVYKNGANVIKTTNFIYDECTTPIGEDLLQYVNKNGERKQIYIGGRQLEGTNVSKGSYRADVGKTVGGNYTYDSSSPQKVTINQTSKQTITINTGWVSDSMNDQFKEMILSEAWSIDVDRPVYLNTNTIQYRENRQDKLINYTFEFEEANNLINDVY